MTADAVRAYMETQGWKLTGVDWCDKDGEWFAQWYDRGDGWSLWLSNKTSTRRIEAPLPSTPADLAALLRCLGAPVVEPPYETEFSDALRIEARAALERLKTKGPVDVHAWARRLAEDVCGEPVKEVPCHARTDPTPAISAESGATGKSETTGQATPRGGSSGSTSPGTAPETAHGSGATETNRQSARGTLRDGPTGERSREQEAIDQTWNMGTCANELADCLRTAKEIAITCTLPIEETIVDWSHVLDRASHYVNGWTLKHERRVADHPELIPDKFGGVVVMNRHGFISSSNCCGDWRRDEWRILMGRRRTDWEGK